MNPEEIIQTWSLACCQTLEERDIDAHMDLISKQVKVYGLAEHEFVDYNFWHNQVSEQFSKGLVKSLRYYLNSMRVESDSQIIFTAIEYITDQEDKEHENSLEVVLTKEADGFWRVTQEKILTEDEARQAGLLTVH